MRMSLGYKPFAAAPPGVVTTLDPTNTIYGTLSGGNLTLTFTGGPTDAAFSGATTFPTSGRRIFGYVVPAEAIPGNFSLLGLAPPGALSGAPPGISGNGLLYVPTIGTLYVDTTPDSVSGGAPGDTVELIYDYALSMAWIAINGTPIAGDPVAGTGGYSMAAGSNMPWFSMPDGVSPVTANFGQTPFSYSGAGIIPWG